MSGEQFLQIIDLVAIAVVCIMLFFLSTSDMKYRVVPASGIIGLMVVGAVFTVLRFLFGGQEVIMTMEVSLFLTGIIALTMSILVYFSGMVGIGDVLTVLAVALTVPYTPIGQNIRVFPAIIPIATILSVIMMYSKIRRSTIVMKDFPAGFRRVCRRKASELKAKKVVVEYPIYIEGIGYVYEKIFNGSPVENTLKILEKISDDVIVYTIPNFPFVYYFTLSFIILVCGTLLIGLLEMMGVI